MSANGDHGCLRNCPDGECYCAEPAFLEVSGICPGCGGDCGECLCGEDDDDFWAYMPEGRAWDALRNPDNRHLY